MLFDRAAALFGTKAAAAERHRATMRRCMVQLAHPTRFCYAGLTSKGPPREARAKNKREMAGVGGRETSLGSSRGVLYGVVPNTNPPAAVACQTRPRARGRDGQ